jgi:hypothetical protein
MSDKQDLYDSPHPLDKVLDMLVLQVKKHVELMKITECEMGGEGYDHHEALLMRLIEHNKVVHSCFQYVMEQTGSIQLAASLQNRFPSRRAFVVDVIKEDILHHDTVSLLSKELMEQFKEDTTK